MYGGVDPRRERRLSVLNRTALGSSSVGEDLLKLDRSSCIRRNSIQSSCSRSSARYCLREVQIQIGPSRLGDLRRPRVDLTQSRSAMLMRVPQRNLDWPASHTRTCQRLDLNDHLRGEKARGRPAGGAPQVPAGVRGKTVSALSLIAASPLFAWCSRRESDSHLVPQSLCLPTGKFPMSERSSALIPDRWTRAWYGWRGASAFACDVLPRGHKA